MATQKQNDGSSDSSDVFERALKFDWIFFILLGGMSQISDGDSCVINIIFCLLAANLNDTKNESLKCSFFFAFLFL